MKKKKRYLKSKRYRGKMIFKLLEKVGFKKLSAEEAQVSLRGYLGLIK